MCGITGIVSFNEKGNSLLPLIHSSIKTLAKRGPDSNGVFFNRNIAIGHTRLKIIDISDKASQPMSDSTGRFTIVFNGEIYNFREQRKILESKGIIFRSNSDTEVLLQLYIQEKEKCLDKLEGDFAFAIYDKIEETLFLARDRFGVKPLLYYLNNEIFIFASEMKAILTFGPPKKIDSTSLLTYLQLNYIPAPYSIFEGIKKLEAGNFIMLSIPTHHCKIEKYYTISCQSDKIQSSVLKYEDAQKELIRLLDISVQKRLVSDVPLGTFLSGGIDSSIITALASHHTKNLSTFSICYKDEPFFDETDYARLVSKKYQTNHTEFSLTNGDLFENLYETLNYIDEPFADSSSIAVSILSKFTKQNVTVALSGDGADEIFTGYNKHRAELFARNPGPREKILKLLQPLWKSLPKSRNSVFGNLVRQFNRFSDGIDLTVSERYWQWASLMNEKDAEQMLEKNLNTYRAEFEKRKSKILHNINDDFNSVLLTDVSLVLQNDMLFKVDLMSMTNSLEVRVPFLDFEVVNFAFSLPAKYKIDRKMRKKILQDAFRSYLPEKLYNRKKHGFEVPLLKWLKTEMKTTITNNLLNENFVRNQNIFSPEEIKKMVSQLFSGNPGDSPAKVWNLIVFQHWWKKHMS